MCIIPFALTMCLIYYLFVMYYNENSRIPEFLDEAVRWDKWDEFYNNGE